MLDIVKYALITGVSTGIGYESLKALIGKGYYVYGSVRTQGDADRLKEEFAQGFTPLIFDVTDQEGVDSAVVQVTADIGNKGLSCLVNNSGIAIAGPLQHQSIGDFESQLIPCCGHFFMANNKGESVEIMGCPNGIDWTIKHTDDNQIKHIAESGEEAIIGKEEYRKQVIEFVNQIDNFYKKGKPKEIPEDEFDRKGYEAFQKEWNRLKKEIKTE